MSDENWPAPTPREEMLARVATRGSRIRAVRGAVNALVILSVVGASALGVGAAIDGLGDGGSTEVENIAMVPEPPETGEVASTGSAPTSGGGASTGSTGTTQLGGTTASDPGTTGAPGVPTSNGGSGTTAGTGTPGAGGRGPSSTAPSTTARPSTSTAPSTTGEPSTTSEPATSTTEVPAPRVGTMRAKVDGDVSTGLTLCDDPTAVLAVEIEGAERATLTWNRAGETRSEEMVEGGSEWSAPISDLDEKAPDVPVFVTITATGPGGTTRTSEAIPVADCTPLPSDPSVRGS